MIMLNDKNYKKYNNKNWSSEKLSKERLTEQVNDKN